MDVLHQEVSNLHFVAFRVPKITYRLRYPQVHPVEEVERIMSIQVFALANSVANFGIIRERYRTVPCSHRSGDCTSV